MSLRDIKVELRPSRVEGELRSYFEKWIRQAHHTHTYLLDDLAKEAIEHVTSRAFLAGKIQAARETHTPWQIVGDDSRIIQRTAEQFEIDFEEIMHDIRLDLIVEGHADWQNVGRRLEVTAQMLTWTAYNRGKASEFRRSIKPAFGSLLMAQRYKYDGLFMLLTQADERVCEICAPYAGNLTEDYDSLVSDLGGEPPLHVSCRCEIVATPTVVTVKEQDRFRENWYETTVPAYSE